jgi:hypothetical protein
MYDEPFIINTGSAKESRNAESQTRAVHRSGVGFASIYCILYGNARLGRFALQSTHSV